LSASLAQIWAPASADCVRKRRQTSPTKVGKINSLRQYSNDYINNCAARKDKLQTGTAGSNSESASGSGGCRRPHNGNGASAAPFGGRLGRGLRGRPGGQQFGA